MLGWGALGLLTLVTGCVSQADDASDIFNPAFINTFWGGQFPLTPGPGAAYVMVRVVNETNQQVEFIVTIEREVLAVNENGEFYQDATGNWVTMTVQEEPVSIQTTATGQSTEAGVLFTCSDSPVTVVGLGENLLPTDSAVFVDGDGAGGASGFGVPVGSLNPLTLASGNFNCGDTIIYQAFISTGQVGGVGLAVYLLPGSEQPDEFTGPDTFVNLQDYLAAQGGEDDEP